MAVGPQWEVGTLKYYSYLMETNGAAPTRLQGPWNPYDPNCPTRQLLDVIGDRWTVLIVGALEERTRRFSELRAMIEAFHAEGIKVWVDVVFNAAGGGDITPPTVSAVTPVNGAGGVAITSGVTATFTETMTASTVASNTFELRDVSGALVPATVIYNVATRTVTLQPTAALGNSTIYTATVKGGAVDPRVKDAAGNPMASNASWSFTTVQGADTTPPAQTC